VSRRPAAVVVFQWDDAESERFWLIRDYMRGEYHALKVGAS
jgi:hypothetical protein